LKGKGEVLGDESIVIIASKAIDISHHLSWAMEDLKEATKEFLGPAADLMNGAIILQNFFDSAAVAEPKEFGAPKKFPILANSPAPATGFTDKGVKMTLALGAAAGTELDGTKAGAIHSDVELTDAVGAKKGQSVARSVRIVRLH
jgi:hypothetical protein